MKMNVSAPCVVALVLFSSLLLQGCDFGSKAEKEVKIKEKQTEVDEFGAAQCLNKTFSCSGNWRSWCAQQKKRCEGVAPDPAPADCTPKCTWECGTAKCDQVCAPKCDKAICTTRCKGFNTQSCSMKCGKPSCKVVCPKHFCPGQQCAACKTECGPPQCQMQCEKQDEQPCRNVCAQPRCKWECKAPTECPKPKCAMKCQKPRGCMDNTHMVQQLPPLLPGETEVTSFHTVPSQSPAPAPPAPLAAASPAPAEASLLGIESTAHTKASTSMLLVNIATMQEDRSLQKRQVDLQLAPMDVTTSFTWTKSIHKHNGQVTENDAACKKDGFQCKGDKTWCQEQEAIMNCETPESDQEFIDVVQAAEAAQSEPPPTVNVQVASAAGTADAVRGSATDDEGEEDEQEEEEPEDAAVQVLNTVAKQPSKFLRQKQGHLNA